MTTALVLLRVTVVALVAGTALLVMTPVLAQCAMCGLSAEAAADPETVSRTFNAAVLVLLVPVVGVFAVVARVTWKARHWDGALLDVADDGPVNRQRSGVNPRR